jgi:putative hydrolase of the HAD superfamily
MIKGLLFDLNGTIIDIYTSESDDQIYRTVSNFLDYYRIKISPQTLKEEYFNGIRRQKKESAEEFPEFDVVKLFREIITSYSSPESLSVEP